MHCLLRALVLILLPSAPAVAAALDCTHSTPLKLSMPVELTLAERAGFVARPPLRILAANAPPISRLRGAGLDHHGVGIDFLCLLSGETGLRFEIDSTSQLTVSEKIAAIQSGQADLFLPLSHTPERSTLGGASKNLRLVPPW